MARRPAAADTADPRAERAAQLEEARTAARDATRAPAREQPVESADPPA